MPRMPPFVMNVRNPEPRPHPRSHSSAVRKRISWRKSCPGEIIAGDGSASVPLTRGRLMPRLLLALRLPAVLALLLALSGSGAVSHPPTEDETATRPLRFTLEEKSRLVAFS